MRAKKKLSAITRAIEREAEIKNARISRKNNV